MLGATFTRVLCEAGAVAPGLGSQETVPASPRPWHPGGTLVRGLCSLSQAAPA